jgi:transcriptional regulator GlxA family with amidase domain
MSFRIGILIFDGAEELDFVGPWEVFTMANGITPGAHECILIAERDAPVTCAKGMRVLPNVTMATCPQLDVLLVPGGVGSRREATNEAFTHWVSAMAGTCTWIASVCTGTRILGAAGLLNGKRVTTHWRSIDDLRASGQAGEVLENIRYVRDGNLVTSAGVSAGIDMALWLTGQLHSPDFARQVQKAMEYNPAPPYAAEM